jgi:hypothetical protein
LPFTDFAGLARRRHGLAVDHGVEQRHVGDRVIVPEVVLDLLIGPFQRERINGTGDGKFRRKAARSIKKI